MENQSITSEKSKLCNLTRIKSSLGRSVLLVLIPSLTGCTSALWTPACATQAIHPQIAGLVRNYPAAGNQSLIVAYRAPLDGTDVDLVVPLDSACAPLAPFAVQGQAYALRQEGSKDWVELAGSVDPRQLAALVQSGNAISSDRPKLAKHLSTVDWSPVQVENLDWPDSLRNQPGSACMIAYRLDAAGQVVPTPIDTVKQPDGKIVLDPAIHILLVPTAVNRPPGDQTRNKIAAVLLTPVTVVTDAAGAVGITAAGAAACAVVIPLVAVVIVADPHHWDESSRPSVTTQPTVQVPVYLHGENELPAR